MKDVAELIEQQKKPEDTAAELDKELMTELMREVTDFDTKRHNWPGGIRKRWRK